jgi:monofunctional biosynthetic peptidoglycan transglycosylase
MVEFAPPQPVRILRFMKVPSFFRRQPSTPPENRSRFKTFLRRGALLLLLFLLLDGLYLLWLMPDWGKLAKGPVPKSAFMLRYEELRTENPKLPQLRWNPVPLSAISQHVRRAVVVAEDSRFYEHPGIDLTALQEVWDYNLEHGRAAFGGSTLSQQLVKNLFLSPSRNPLRKWHELWLTLIMEQQLSKRRILELYLNVAEFGPGIYGVEAASRRYWGISAGALSIAQAIELAATLPSPKENNPATRTRFFLNKVKKIRRHMGLGTERNWLEDFFSTD